MRYTLAMFVAMIGLALAGCQSQGGFHDSIKLQVAGAQFSPATGAIFGYVAGTVDRSQNVDKDGKPIVVQGCNGRGQDSPDTFSNLNSKANASAQSVIPNVNGAAGGVQAPSVAWASGDTSANGSAAIVAAAQGTAHPADTIAALCDNHDLPTAPPSSIVRDGVSPH